MYQLLFHVLQVVTLPGIILYMRPANGRRRYNVTSSLIGWAHTQSDPCLTLSCFLLWHADADVGETHGAHRDGN